MQLVLLGCAQVVPDAPTTLPTSLLPATFSVETITPRFTDTPVVGTVIPTISAYQKTLLFDVPEDCFASSMSPDFKWILLQCGGDVSAIEIAKEGASPISLPKHGGIYFSTDSKQLAVTTVVYDSDGSKGNSWEIWLYNVGEWQTPRRIISLSSRHYIHLNWAPDDQSIAVSFMEEGYALSILYLDGTYKNLLTYEDIQLEEVRNHNRFGPSWSPDGSKLTYVHVDSLESQPVQIWTVEVATDKKELLYSGKPGQTGANPRWSPDGERIAFLSIVYQRGFPRLFIYNIQDQSILEFDGFGSGGWSPNGQYLLSTDPPNIYVINAETHKSVLLCQTCQTLFGWNGNDAIIVEDHGMIYSISDWWPL